MEMTLEEALTDTILRTSLREMFEEFKKSGIKDMTRWGIVPCNRQEIHFGPIAEGTRALVTLQDIKNEVIKRQLTEASMNEIFVILTVEITRPNDLQWQIVTAQEIEFHREIPIPGKDLLH